MSTFNAQANTTQPIVNRSCHDTLNDNELLRYSRQLLLDGWGLDAQEQLKQSHVIIIGVGGLGCPLAETLARAGVGHIHLIDHDKIEASNLQRQTLFLPQDIGHYKAEQACTVLSKINPYLSLSYAVMQLAPDTVIALTEVIAQNRAQHADARSQSQSRTLLIDCSDNFATRLLLNEVSVQTKMPLLSASAIAMTGQLALYESYQNTGCYYCVFGEAIKQSTKAQSCATSGVLASTTAVMGNLQATVALQYLGLDLNPLSGQLLNWDGKRMTQQLISFKRNHACPVCG